MPLRIGTRGSRLALAQAAKVSMMLNMLGHQTRMVTITTKGDAITGVPLHEIGGQGVFVRALDESILSGEIDIAVHSMKDIPAKRPAGLVTGAILARDSPADYLVSDLLSDRIKVVGTSSTRRAAQFRRHFPGIGVKPLRGNVDTRLRKLRSREFDAIVLAEAGLQRMDMAVPGMSLDPKIFVPSPNQGTIAVVNRDERELTGIMAHIDHLETRTDTGIERAVMEEVGGGCFTPQGIFCKDGYLIAEILSLDGTKQVRLERLIGNLEEARLCGREIRDLAGPLIREAYEKLGIMDDR